MILNLIQPDVARLKLPTSLEDKLTSLKDLSSKEEVLRFTYELLRTKYRGFPIGTPLEFGVLFNMDIDALWHKNGPQYCTNMNYLMVILLVKSGWFNPCEIQLRWTVLRFFSPHQYMRIQVQPDQNINIDIWGSSHGIKFGDYAHGFHLRS